MKQADKLNDLISQSQALVFLGGAGVSTESGIPDFRSESGLYSQHADLSPEIVLSHVFFNSNPEQFFDFYKKKIINLEAKPNPAHQRLAALEAEGRLVAVITQNIDGLHQQAGSRKVIELHGSIYHNTCLDCHRKYDIGKIVESVSVPHCSCGGIIKPDVILYGEALDPDVITRAVKVLSEADLLIIGGTSLAVYPAAGLIDYYQGKNLVIINSSPTPYDRQASLLIRQPIGQVLASIPGGFDLPRQL